MDQVLSLETRDGNYFHARQFVYYDLAQLEPYRVQPAQANQPRM